MSRVEERVDALFIEETGFLEVEAEEVPGGAQVLAEGLVLELVVNGEFFEEVGLEGFEVLLEVVGDDEVAGGEAVLESVLGGDGFAFGGTGSGGTAGGLRIHTPYY